MKWHTIWSGIPTELETHEVGPIRGGGHSLGVEIIRSGIHTRWDVDKVGAPSPHPHLHVFSDIHCKTTHVSSTVMADVNKLRPSSHEAMVSCHSSRPSFTTAML